MNRATTIVVAAVLSHFLLDAIAYRPDLPIFPNQSDGFKRPLLCARVLLTFLIAVTTMYDSSSEVTFFYLFRLALARKI